MLKKKNWRNSKEMKDYLHDTLYTDTILKLCLVCHTLYDLKNDYEFKKHSEHELNYIKDKNRKVSK